MPTKKKLIWKNNDNKIHTNLKKQMMNNDDDNEKQNRDSRHAKVKNVEQVFPKSH